jgi:hypothetical protein
VRKHNGSSSRSAEQQRSKAAIVVARLPGAHSINTLPRFQFSISPCHPIRPYRIFKLPQWNLLPSPRQPPALSLFLREFRGVPPLNSTDEWLLVIDQMRKPGDMTGSFGRYFPPLMLFITDNSMLLKAMGISWTEESRAGKNSIDRSRCNRVSSSEKPRLAW